MTVAPFLTAAEATVPAFLAELANWVNIDSGTSDKAGVDRVGALVKARLERSGFAVTIHPQTDHGDHLLARRTGNGTQRLLLIGHLDTVYPTGNVAQRPFAIRDGKAYGPGVFDMKSGILAGITALDLVGPAVLDQYATVTWLCNSDEETGSPTSTPLVREEARNADAVLVLEPTRALETLTVARKGVAAYTLDVTGLSAHAGANPEAGNNAILELAHLIVQLHALHGTLPSLSLNVGGITGGGQRNVVPARAQAIFEMRAANQEVFRAGHAAIAEIIAAPRTVAGTVATLTQGATHEPLELTEGTRHLLRVAATAAEPLGITLRPLSVGGASDGNTTGGMGIPTLDGLGLVGQNAHNPEEHIIVDYIPLRLAFLAGIITDLVR